MRLVVFFESIMQGVEVSIYPDLLLPITGVVSQTLRDDSTRKSDIVAVEKHFLRL